MTDPNGSGALIERSFPTWATDSRFLPASLYLAGDRLGWEGEGLERLPGGPGILEDFVALVDDEGPGILHFAKRWGPLWLCDCGRPWGHPDDDAVPHCYHGGDRDPWTECNFEHLTTWRAYARRAHAVLRVAAIYYGVPVHDGVLDVADIRREEVRAAWRDLLETSTDVPSGRLTALRHRWDSHIERCRPGAPPAGGRLCGAENDHQWCWECGVPRCAPPEAGPFELGTVVDEWLAMSGVRLSFSWHDEGAEMGFEPWEGLLSEIGLQLAVAVARGDGLAICAECSRPFAPKRRPARGRRSFCPACGPRAASKQASRDHRDREAARDAAAGT